MPASDAFVMRDANGDIRVEYDRHIEGLFPRAAWLDAFNGAGARVDIDPWGRDVFVAHPR